MNPYLNRINKSGGFFQSQRRARVEIIPLIDVMFLLVAFFMVISISMVVQKGIFVDLAPAETGSTSKPETGITVSVDKEGKVYLEKKEISILDLDLELKKLAISNKNITVTLNADKDSRHSHLIKALDLIRQSGLHNVVFSVEPEAK